MNWFTIDTDNTITAYTSSDEANAQTSMRFAFADEASLTTILEENGVALANELWNSIPGAKKRKFKTATAAAPAIWKQIQSLSKAAETASVRAPRAKAAATKPKASKKATPKTKAPKAPKPAKEAKPKKERKPKKEATGLREGSKAAQVVELLKRPEGATLAAIMKKFGWLAHTTRALLSAGGSLRKAGYNVESFKPEGGERSYRIAS